MKQKFFKNDLVRIVKKLPPYMTHFPGAGQLAYVVASYKDLYGGRDLNSYALEIIGHGRVSWYPARLLKLVKRHGKCPTCGQSVEGR